MNTPIYKNSELELYKCSGNDLPSVIKFIDGSVSCGFASPANDFVHDPIDVRDLLIDNPEATFIIRATGTSMIDAGIADGDYLIIDRGKPYYPDGVALCCVNGEFTVKRVNKETATLVPANKNFKPITLTDGDELIIWGMVCWVLKKEYGV